MELGVVSQSWREKTRDVGIRIPEKGRSGKQKPQFAGFPSGHVRNSKTVWGGGGGGFCVNGMFYLFFWD